MQTTPLVRVPNQELSLWQSVVAETAMAQTRLTLNEQDAASLTIAAIQHHPMINATNIFVTNAIARDPMFLFHPSSPSLVDSEIPLQAYLSELCFNIARARVREDTDLETSLLAVYETRKYSDSDLGFLSCVTTYLEYKRIYNGRLKYNDWRVAGRDIHYGVIDWKLPNNAKVAIIGDWGTGMSDAISMLRTLIVEHRPDAIIHLGDIYYSGTPEECRLNFLDPIRKIFNDTGHTCPVFTIPGNHDYYAFAYGYYNMVEELNRNDPSCIQPASYFCLRTEDNGWQFLGMDTGYQDCSPFNQFNPDTGGPGLQPSEITWHLDKLVDFPGATIALSHHQLYSANAKINGGLTRYKSYPYLNKKLLDVFQPFFGSEIAAWLWGHEHNLVVFNDNNFGLPKGRLIGASAFEELTTENPYHVKYPSVPIQTEYMLGSVAGYYNHSYAIIDMGGRASPTSPVSIEYYEYPSWGIPAPNPIPDKSSKMLKEPISIKVPVKGKQIPYNQAIQFSLENGFNYISHVKKSVEYYPTLGPDAIAIQLLPLLGPKTFVGYEDMVLIQSLEPALGIFNLMAPGPTPALYYFPNKGSSNANSALAWVILTPDARPKGAPILEGEPVYFVSVLYNMQYLCPLIEPLASGTYLTSDANVPSNWFLKIT